MNELPLRYRVKVIRKSLRYVEELSEVVQQQLALAYRAKDLLGFGLRARMREGYSAADFRADLLAALVVGVVALPLSMALAIASGVPPQMGLYTAIVAGFACSLLGGTRFQVTGPTAAFVVILVPVVQKFGIGGLLVSGMLAGAILVGMGLARMGKLMQFVPHPVTTGFTTGIAVVIALFQLKDLLGIALPPTDGIANYLETLWAARGGANFWDLGIAAVTFGLLIAAPAVSKRIPPPLFALVVMSIAVHLADRFLPSFWSFHATTIGSKFTFVLDDGTIGHGIPPLPPLPMVPWQEFHVALDLHTVRELLPSSFAIAMLGAIESLIAAVVADGMSGSRHDPNAELIGLGIGNMLCPFFGGIAATGALARTATNIRAGARSPLSAAMHSVFILACTIVLAPLVSYLPMAALAALLVLVARNMSEARHFLRLARIAPRHDVIVMLTCFVLTVVFDMVIAVTAGVVLAALLFMRRMSVLTKAELEIPTDLKVVVPAGVRVYEIAGPLFFGAAKSAMEALHTVGDNDHTYIIDMQHVPTMDATGLVALESVLDRLRRSKIHVIFSGLTAEVSDMLDRAGFHRVAGRIAYAPNVETAVSMAIVHAAHLRGPIAPAEAT